MIFETVDFKLLWLKFVSTVINYVLNYFFNSFILNVNDIFWGVFIKLVLYNNERLCNITIIYYIDNKK